MDAVQTGGIVALSVVVVTALTKVIEQMIKQRNGKSSTEAGAVDCIKDCRHARELSDQGMMGTMRQEFAALEFAMDKAHERQLTAQQELTTTINALIQAMTEGTNPRIRMKNDTNF